MVKLQVKHGDDNQFLVETTTDKDLNDLALTLVAMFNMRLKILRICGEIEELAEHGTSLPPNMQGLADEQISDLKLVDEWENKCIPSGGSVEKKDPIGRRNGKAPNDKMAGVLRKTIKETKELISKKKVDSNTVLLEADVKEALAILKGCVTIVYPMGLPPHDPIKMEFDGKEELDGTQAKQDLLDPSKATMYWAGKELSRDKKLGDFIGKNEKTKLVIKLQKGKGVPAREAVVSEKEQKEMMAFYYRKQEEMKKLEECSDDSYYDSAWSDSNQLKRSFQGLDNMHFKPGKKF